MASAASGPSTFAQRVTSVQGVPAGTAESASAGAPLATPGPVSHDPPLGGGLEDRELISRMRRGDDTALLGLYQRYGGHALALLARIVGDRAEAEALLQEVFLQAWRRAPEYDPQQSLPAWLFGFARARALEALRAPMQSIQRHPAQAAGMSSEPQVAQQAVPAAGRAAVVQRALAGLSDSEREALELAYYGGLSPGEISARLGLPADQVLFRIRQGVARLRALRG